MDPYPQTLRDNVGNILDSLTQRQPHEIVRLQSLVDQAGIPLTAAAAAPPHEPGDDMPAAAPLPPPGSALHFQQRLQRTRCLPEDMPAPIPEEVSAAASLCVAVQGAVLEARAAAALLAGAPPSEPSAALARVATAVRTSLRDRTNLLRPGGGATGFVDDAPTFPGGGGGGGPGLPPPPRPGPGAARRLQNTGGGAVIHTLGGAAAAGRRGGSGGGPAGWLPVSALPPDEQEAAMQGLFGNEYGEGRGSGTGAHARDRAHPPLASLSSAVRPMTRERSIIGSMAREERARARLVRVYGAGDDASDDGAAAGGSSRRSRRLQGSGGAARRFAGVFHEGSDDEAMAQAPGAAPAYGGRNERYGRVMAASAPSAFAAASAGARGGGRGRGAGAVRARADAAEAAAESAESWESRSEGGLDGDSGSDSGSSSSGDGRAVGAPDSFVAPPPGATAPAALEAAFVPGHVLDDGTRVPPKVRLGSMHRCPMRPGTWFGSPPCWLQICALCGRPEEESAQPPVSGNPSFRHRYSLPTFSPLLPATCSQPSEPAPPSADPAAAAAEALHRGAADDESDDVISAVPTRRASQRLGNADTAAAAPAPVPRPAAGRPVVRGGSAAVARGGLNPLAGVEGALLPLPLRMSASRVAWVHANCAAFSPQALFVGAGDAEPGEATAPPDVLAALRGTWRNVAREVRRWGQSVHRADLISLLSPLPLLNRCGAAGRCAAATRPAASAAAPRSDAPSPAAASRSTCAVRSARGTRAGGARLLKAGLTAGTTARCATPRSP